MTPTTTSTYTPTLMEKLLDKNYKWWFLFIYCLKSSTVYFWSEAFIALNKTLTLLGNCVIFLYLGQKNDQPILNYLLLGSIFFAVTDPVIAWFVSGNIKSGKMTKWLMYPVKYLDIIFWTAVANCIYLSATCLVSLIPVVLLFYKYIDLSGNFWILLPFLAVSFLIRFSLQTLTGMGAFWFTEGSGINYLVQNLENFLSGSMFPLYILPVYLGWLQYLPFAFTFYHPMQIYLGKYSNLEILYVFLVGIFWCFVLYFLAKLVFKIGLKKNESVGL